MATQRTAPTLADIQEARRRLQGIAEETPIYLSETFSRRCGREVRLKAENLQRTGAFKVRGAVNKLATLSPEERAAGVVAASAGNHGQAVAWAARELGVHARIYVPVDAPMAKVEACRNYGAETEMTGAYFEDALAAARADAEETGGTFIHPYEDPLVIAGQGTIGLELVEQAPDVETVLIPVGGGGLALGIAIVLRALRPQVRIVGVQAGLGGYTIADGIAVKVPSEFTMPLLEDLLDDLVAVGDEEISEAIVLLLERAKLVVEGAGAVGVAALLAGRAGGTGPAIPVLSGGNIDPTMLISDQAALARCRGARQRHLRRAPPGGDGHSCHGDGSGAHAGDPRRGTLPAIAERDGRTRLCRPAIALDVEPRRERKIVTVLFADLVARTITTQWHLAAGR